MIPTPIVIIPTVHPLATIQHSDLAGVGAVLGLGLVMVTLFVVWLIRKFLLP